ncbi:virulence factor [Salmonella bongori]|uniref:virulence protein PagD n=1 Tax=Salmonella bongori TaxID=54736 RepID=UPI0009A98669|nr:virulence protein PagD [Salmonella bongori]EDP8628090.1 virulence factor [Salmonella bongori]EDP8657714.1 virulence factor [Salmonella bongori]EEU7166501.1 virulence factor [Salmonella bongori]EIU0393595.1 virulence factor [Salmonella bongori]
MKHHVFMLCSLIIFSFPTLTNAYYARSVQQASWEIFIYDFGSKTPPPPPATAGKKHAKKINLPPCSAMPPKATCPVNETKKNTTFSRT